MTKLIDEIFESNLQPMRVWSHKARQEVRNILEGKVFGYKTGLKDLDRIVRLFKGDMIVIAGQSGMGKTSLALQLLESIQKQTEAEKGQAAMFSAEMSGVSLAFRLAADMANVTVWDAKAGNLSREKLLEVDKQLKAIEDMNLWIDDNSQPTTGQMLTQLDGLRKDTNVVVGAMDFAELAGDQDQKEEHRLRKIAQNCAGIAKVLKMPFMLLSQLNDEANQTPTKIAQGTQTRGSKGIFNLANLVLIPVNPMYYVSRGIPIIHHTTGEPYTEETAQGKALIIVSKNKEGQPGIVEVGWNAEKMRFVDLYRPF